MKEIEKTLHKLKLPGMADCWTSLYETHKADKLTLDKTVEVVPPISVQYVPVVSVESVPFSLRHKFSFRFKVCHLFRLNMCH